MSLNLNHVVLAGHLTRDPELRQIGVDKVVANTSIAINRRWKDPTTGEQREEATFIEIEAWSRTAELMGQYLKKGSAAYIEGRLKVDTWDDKDSGQKRSRVKVVADTVQFLGGRPGEDGERQPHANVNAGPAARPAASAPAPKRRPAPTAVAAPEDGDPPF